jgi:hypothetical protein
MIILSSVSDECARSLADLDTAGLREGIDGGVSLACGLPYTVDFV